MCAPSLRRAATWSFRSRSFRAGKDFVTIVLKAMAMGAERGRECGLDRAGDELDGPGAHRHEARAVDGAAEAGEAAGGAELGVGGVELVPQRRLGREGWRDEDA